MKLIKLFRNHPLNIFIAQVDYHNGEGRPDLRNWFMEFNDFEKRLYGFDGTIYDGVVFDYVQDNLERLRATGVGEAMVRTSEVITDWRK